MRLLWIHSFSPLEIPKADSNTKVYIFLIFILVLMVYCQSAMAKLGFELFEVNNLGPTGVTYKVLVIRDSSFRQYNANNENYPSTDVTLEIAERARQWSFDQFKKYYVNYTDADWERLKHSDNLSDARSTRIIIMENKTEQIVGTLKLVYDDRKSKLPIEDIFDFKYERKIEISDNYFYQPEKGQFIIYDNNVNGGVVQLMEFVTSKKDINALLHLMSELDLYLKPDAELPQVMFKGKSQAIWPSEYVLYCDERMLAYYEQMGFEKFIQKGNLYGMKMSRLKYIKVPIESSIFRKNNRLLNAPEVNITWKANAFTSQLSMFPVTLEKNIFSNGTLSCHNLLNK